MIRIAICDDEKDLRAYLTSLVRKVNTDCEITEYASAEECLSGGMEMDLLFLDVELQSGTFSMDGLHLAKQIRSMELKKQPIIIFVTGYREYVFDAFDVGAFQYLIKPIDEQKFSEVFSRALRQILTETEQRKKLLVIQYEGANKTIPIGDIYYIESQNHKAVLHKKSGKLEYYARIGDLEEELQEQFFRIHKGYLINLAFVDKYSKTEVTLVNNDKLPVSKYKYADFVKAYQRFMEQGEG